VPVYDRRYRGYDGERHPPRGLFWTLTRYGLAEVFSSRLLLVLFVGACLPVVVGITLIYVANNLDLLSIFDSGGGDPGENRFVSELGESLSGTLFFWFVAGQANLAFLFAAFAAPTLVGPDLAHGAMPLYLSRPLSRTDYVVGKFAILATLLSAITWVPGLLLVVVQSALAGGGWLLDHFRVPLGIVVGSVLWIVLLSFTSLAVSAWIRWRALATGALFVLFVLGGAFGAAINQILGTRWGTLLMFDEQMRTIWLHLLDVGRVLGRSRGEDDLPVIVCWMAITVAAALAALLLHRRIRAYEVVR
jgi:ABC-type transport system involved in multi-copper enzyme maturation permease subunit